MTTTTTFLQEEKTTRKADLGRPRATKNEIKAEIADAVFSLGARACALLDLLDTANPALVGAGHMLEMVSCGTERLAYNIRKNVLDPSFFHHFHRPSMEAEISLIEAATMFTNRAISDGWTQGEAGRSCVSALQEVAADARGALAKILAVAAQHQHNDMVEQSPHAPQGGAQ